MGTEQWQIDLSHTTISFTVSHMLVARVHGRFTRFEGLVRVEGADLSTALAEVRIEAASIDTGVVERDNHLRSGDFFDTERFKHATFRSKRVEVAGQDRYLVVGDLTIKGVTHEETLEVRHLGALKDPWGAERMAFSAHASIERGRYGLTWNQALEVGGVLVGERVTLSLDVQAVKVDANVQAA